MDPFQTGNARIIKAFCVCGLNELKIQKYSEEKQYPFIQNVDIIEKKIENSTDTIETNGEKW
jgi:hypothetical protein